jgi:hypothetical protein
VLEFVDLQGDPISSEFGFVVSYAPVEPFWDFDDNPLAMDVHETLPSTPATVVAGKAAIDLHLQAGRYYLVTVADNSGSPTYLGHRIHLYGTSGYQEFRREPMNDTTTIVYLQKCN